uniref:tripartite tricarboxylate transporter permease n=1 Tax=Antarctobacter sp. TaxID=1872577 RepID=UPI002B276258|nr:tripartite tricarboxylate transporter permease [Antarctobacter sp.]
MVDFSLLLAGFADVFTLTNMLFILGGVALGQIVGAIPGLSIIMALAIAVPLTYGLDTLAAISFLISVNKGGTIGGAVPAILLNVPGSAESAATTMDGHPMAKNGKPMKAMKYALYHSVSGDLASDIVLILLAAPLAIVALNMGPVEITALMILAFTVISGLVGDSMIKGLISAAFGILVATVGLDPGMATPRFTFDILEFYDGVPLTAVSIGALAMSGVLVGLLGMRATDETQNSAISIKGRTREESVVTFAEFWANRFVAMRAFFIGTIIGAIPGLGSTTAGFLSYSVNKQAAKDPEAFGKGDARGIAASETANSAVVGANLIPLLTLGIPGNIAAALLVSAFIIHGIQPGPLLFEQQAQLVYGMFGAMLVANFCNLGVGQFGMRFWAMVVSAPGTVIYPAAMLLCFAGSFVITGATFGVYVMITAAVFGYLMRSFGYSIVAFIVAFLLTPQLESAVVRARLITNDNPAELFSHPIALVLIAMSVGSIIYLGPRKKKAPRDGDLPAPTSQ